MKEILKAESKSTILIIDDDSSQLKTLADLFELEELQPICCQSGQEALKICQKQKVNVAILDLRLPDISGVAMLKKLKAQNPKMKIIINTAYATLESAIDAINEEVFAYVKKMGNVEELLGHVHRAFHSHLAEYSDSLEVEVKKRTEALLKANKELRESEERLTTLVKFSPDIIFTVNRQAEISFINRPGQGFEYSEVMGNTDNEYLADCLARFPGKLAAAMIVPEEDDGTAVRRWAPR